MLLRRMGLTIMMLAFMAGICVPAEAVDTYPHRAITIIIPVGAGSVGDIFTRVVGEEVSKKLGVPVVIENKPGADGLIATTAAYKASPDGYTLLLGLATGISMLPNLKKTPFDPLKFEFIAPLGDIPFYLAVRSDLPVHTVQEFVVYAKDYAATKDPAGLNWVRGNGMGTFLGAQFVARTGIPAVQLPLRRTDVAAAADIAQGQAHFMFGTYNGLRVQVELKKMRILGIVGEPIGEGDEFLKAPDMTTIGIPGWENASTWFGVLAPPGTPRDIVKRLATVFDEVLEMPEVSARRATLGFNRVNIFKEFIKGEVSMYKRIVPEIAKFGVPVE